MRGKDEYAEQVNTYIRITTNRLLEIFNDLSKKGDVLQNPIALIS